LGDGVVLRPGGDLDLAAIPVFAAACSDADTGAPVALDLRGLEFIDSSGLHAIVELHAAIRTRLAIIPGPPRVHRVFELTGLAALLPFTHGD
jgi:anti-anti-sigma factor